jgi:hypothetical protein
LNEHSCFVGGGGGGGVELLLFLFFGGSFYRTTFEHVIIHSLALDTN